MAKIAIIDDAIQDDRLTRPATAHYRLENGLFRKIEPYSSTNTNDTHGTLVTRVLQSYTEDCEIISIQILDDWFTQRTCSAERLITALEFCEQLDIDVIHCSLGTERLSRIRQIRDLLEMFNQRKIPVIAAGSNAMYRTIPASCSGVFGVMCAETDVVPPGAFAFAKDPYLGTELIANYELPVVSNVQYAKSSSLAAPIVTAQVNDLINHGISSSFYALAAALKCCAWPSNSFEPKSTRAFRTSRPIPVVWLVDVFAYDIQAQIRLLDEFALNGYEAVGITSVSFARDVRLLSYVDLQDQSLTEIQTRMLASVRADLLIVFLALDDAECWEQEMNPDTAVLYRKYLENGTATAPRHIYHKILELF